MKRSLPFFLITLVAVAAVSAGVLLYRAKVAQLNTATAPARAPAPALVTSESPAEAKDDPQAEHVRGSANASVTIEEFGDFQCPPCAGLSQALAQIEHEYGNKLRVIFRHFPLKMHANAATAARAAEAAGLQGHFWEMHDLIYKNQNAWSKSTEVLEEFTKYATSLGLDPARFRADLELPAVQERIAQDQERGTSRGVSATPTLFINNVLLPPTSLSDGGLRTAIDAALNPSPTPAATPESAPAATPQP